MSACGTDAVASVRLTCPVGALHVYFNSSSIAEVSPHLVFSGRRAKVAHGVPQVFFLRADTHTHTHEHALFSIPVDLLSSYIHTVSARVGQRVDPTFKKKKHNLL